MSSELKFRQPRIVKGKFQHWHYWGYIDDNKAHFVAPLSPNTGGDSYQLTGLLDKHGKEIYEGDILKMQNKNYLIGAVTFDKGCFDFLDKWIGCMHPVEIIGNQTDTPELLEAQCSTETK